MTDFQVGDRVSVEGVVTHVFASVIEFKPNQSETGGWTFPTDCVTLVERPKRKLRVGSVWERWGVRWVVGFDEDGRQLVNLASGGIADVGLIDASPDAWREVPVEELEREAGQ